MVRGLAALVVLLSCASAVQAGAGVSRGELGALVERAAARGLAADPRWHALIHYERRLAGRGVESTVATPWFFLAETGRHDPAAELRATLAAFLDDREIAARERSAACVFVARRKFLSQRLDLAPGTLGGEDCLAYQRWRAGLAPERLSLVFPASFPNSPSSMFGHTLLRVDSARPAHRTELLSYAINFAAAAGDDPHGLGFAWKGLTGGYSGVFGLFPYYEKVKQYAWIENRDVWSYPLTLETEEIDWLVDHLWEMGGVRFDYYFLTRNCSYQLLGLLEVARPSLRLTERFDWYAIPADTIRALAAVPDLLGEPRYRPSLQTELRRHAEQLAPARRSLARDVAAGRVALDGTAVMALPPAARAGVLEIAHDYLYYRLQSDPADAPADPAQADAILRARSRIARRSPFAPVPRPAVAPDAGHGTLRVAPSLVYADDALTVGFRLRPAYHDLLDDPGGYTDGAEINFLDIGLRFDPRAQDLRVEDLRLLNVISLSPRDDLFRPLSFTFDTGLRRRPSPRVFGERAGDLGYYVEGGPGLAWGDARRLGYVFGLASVDLNGARAPAYALGAGASAGLLVYPRSGWQFKAEAGAIDRVVGADGHYRWATLGQQVRLTRRLALRAVFGWEHTRVGSGARATLGLQAYLQ